MPLRKLKTEPPKCYLLSFLHGFSIQILRRKSDRPCDTHLVSGSAQSLQQRLRSCSAAYLPMQMRRERLMSFRYIAQSARSCCTALTRRGSVIFEVKRYGFGSLPRQFGLCARFVVRRLDSCSSWEGFSCSSLSTGSGGTLKIFDTQEWKKIRVITI